MLMLFAGAPAIAGAGAGAPEIIPNPSADLRYAILEELTWIEKSVKFSFKCVRN